MAEVKEIEQAKTLLKKAAEELAAKEQDIAMLNQEISSKDKLISELTAKHEKLMKDFETVTTELKQIKQAARDIALKEIIDAEEKLGVLETNKEQRLNELRALDDKGGFEAYAKQTKRMLDLHKSIGDRKSLINNSNQATDKRKEIASVLGMEN
ncbi:hypothetical protein C4573_06330 [Candidatus Woesearchaeota archaeon]|nr:MAG: hypothetical protein COT47_01445 [Candidatus Woesearchaeota archaeon CG08_land_8_20_14_0_20_43_7]RJQ15740.1 MAG: hypothetical protein C4573_06330 [Candidatus Woesearchaeota archaeon]